MRLRNKFKASVAILAIGVVGGAFGVGANAQTFDEKGLIFSGDGYEVVVGGRLHLDSVSVSEDVTLFGDKADVRRLRLNATLTMGDNWKAKIDGDVGGVSTGWKNVWVAYKGFENTTIKVGNFIAPFDGENMMSSNNLKLMERSLPATLAPNFLVGAAATYKGENWSLAGGYFENPLENDPLALQDEGKSVVGRFVFSPIKEKRQVLHFAVAAERRELDNNATSRVSAHPEFGLTGVTLINTPSLAGVDGFTNFNIEAAYMNGPFLVKAQRITRKNDAPTLGDPEYSGGSIEAAWAITGERQRYSSSAGTFGSIKTRRSSRLGAFEVAARYSTLNLSDASVAGGEQSNWTVGANWYVNRNARLMLNYVKAETSPGANTLNENVDAVMGRLQINY
jgi:phosphate-selective porin OprO and OprP